MQKSVLKFYLPGFIVLVLIVGLFALQANAQNTDLHNSKTASSLEKDAPTKASESKLLEDRVLGNTSAPVTIYDYSSLTCPHCADFHMHTLPEIQKQLIDTGKAKLVFRDFPLDKNALHASILARCADPSRFYPLINMLFENQKKWALADKPDDVIATYGALAGLDRSKFDSCLADKNLENAILAGQVDGQKKFSINATPSFVIMASNGRQKTLTGELSADEFTKAINSLTQ